MPRATRLIDIVQALRRHKRPVTARALSEDLEVSERTIYRDVVALQATGAPIRGEAGVGYVLDPGYDLPPLMFGEDELEAIMLGLRFVRERGDDALAAAAEDAAARIEAVLPERLRPAFADAALYAHVWGQPPQETVDPGELRRAIRARRRVAICYLNLAEQRTERTIWPLALGYWNRSTVVVGWCEMRQDFRSFRTDRIEQLEVLDQRYPGHRKALLAEWQRREAARGQAQRVMLQPADGAARRGEAA